MGRYHATRPSRFCAFQFLAITTLWFGPCLDIDYQSSTGSVACIGWGG